jgi:hypothetical protein
VGGVVARHLQRLGAPGGHHLEPHVAVDGAGQVDGLPVEAGHIGRLGQASADLLADEVGDARAASSLLLRAVGERHLHDFGHGEVS